MVYVPFDGQTPLDPDPVLPQTDQLVTNRNLTHWFITQDPTNITFIPREEVKSGSGGKTWQDLPPRPEQTVKLIYPFGQSDGAVPTIDGQERKYAFIVVGEWNATIHTNDFWEDPDGQFWIVTGLSPYNGYEVKAMISSFGGSPGNG